MRSIGWLKVLIVVAVVAAGLLAWRVIGAPEPEDDAPVIESATGREIPLRTVPRTPSREVAAPTNRVEGDSTTTAAVEVPTTDTSSGGLLADAWRALKRLKEHVKGRRAINEEILTSLEEVAGYYLRPPPSDKRLILQRNLARVAKEEGWPAAYLKEVEKFRAAAETVFRKALMLEKVPRGSDRNIRADVNIRAAQLLGKTENPALAKVIQSALEKKIFRAKYEVPMQLLEACFGSLASIGTEKSFQWMTKEFTHNKMSPPKYVDQLVAAHGAMLRYGYEATSSKSRYELVKSLVITYSGVESLARQSTSEPNAGAAKVFWSRVRPGVIKAVQRFSGGPENDEGEALATMLEFREWFRAHKNPNKPPWRVD